MNEKIDREKIIERIKSLMALGDSSRNDSEAEAATAIKKMQELLQKHNLDISEISVDDPNAVKVGEGIVDEISAEFRKSSLSSWEGSLAATVGSATETKAYTEMHYIPGTKSGKIFKIRFIGTPWDVAVAKEMYKFLHSTIKRLSIRYYPNKSSDQRCFMEGCCGRLNERISEQNAKFRNQQQTNQKYALMVVSKKDAIDIYCKEKLQMMKAKKIGFGQGENNNMAYQHGRSAANKIDIGNERRLQ